MLTAAYRKLQRICSIGGAACLCAGDPFDAPTAICPTRYLETVASDRGRGDRSTPSQLPPRPVKISRSLRTICVEHTCTQCQALPLISQYRYNELHAVRNDHSKSID
jgi:hypothetical protein